MNNYKALPVSYTESNFIMCSNKLSEKYSSKMEINILEIYQSH